MSYSFIHPTAIIGEPPEWRDWKPGDYYYWPSIHPEAKIGAYVTIDGGIKRRTTVGARSWAMKHVHLGHDVLIGEDCELSPGVVIGGLVEIGDRVKIGINACVRPEVTIGDGARIGAGAVVVTDVPPGEVWAGVPARRLGASRCVVCGDKRVGDAPLELCEACAPLAAFPGAA